MLSLPAWLLTILAVLKALVTFDRAVIRANPLLSATVAAAALAGATYLISGTGPAVAVVAAYVLALIGKA